MAWECQRAPAREAEAARQQWRRLPYPRCTFERVAHLVGQQAAARDARYRALADRERNAALRSRGTEAGQRGLLTTSPAIGCQGFAQNCKTARARLALLRLQRAVQWRL